MEPSHFTSSNSNSSNSAASNSVTDPTPRFFRFIGLLVAIIGLIGFGVAVVSLIHYKEFVQSGASSGSICNISARINCDAVNSSEWASLMGIPTALYGCWFFALFVLTALLFVHRPRASLLGVLLGFTLIGCGVSALLLGVSMGVIHALCPLCFIIYLTNFSLFAALLYLAIRARSVYQTSLHSLLGKGVVAIVSVPQQLFRPTYAAHSAEVFFGWLFLLAFTMGSLFALDWLPEGTSPATHTRTSATSSQTSPAQVRPTPTPSPASLEGVVSPTDIQAWERAPAESLGIMGGDVTERDFVLYPDGKVEIIEFSDFECPACQRASLVLKELSRKFGPKLRIVHKNFPLDQSCNKHLPQPLHERACFAAALARCAGEQGRFWEASHALFTTDLAAARDNRSVTNELASSLALAPDALNECVSSERHRTKLLRDIEEAIRLRIMGTPTIWINRKRFQGVINGATLSAIIEKELATSTK